MANKRVRVLIGDIFKSSAQTLVNTVNTVGVMGKGLALEFKKRFPDMYKDYVERCKKGEVRLGRPYLYKKLITPWILLFPTKQDWRSVSKLSDIEVGLKHLEKNYKSWGITSLAIPPLGCGLGELNWDIVGPTLYRYLNRLEIPVELYAPYGTPVGKLKPEFLGEPSESQLIEQAKRPESKIEPGFISILEALSRLENIPYHWPVGRTTFQKITYFGTLMGLETGLRYTRASYGPFSSKLKSKLTKLVNNGLIKERKIGETFKDARDINKNEIKSNQEIIDKLIDLFCRLNTKQAEMAATVHFAYSELKKSNGGKLNEDELLNKVINWKHRRKPKYNETEVANTIRNLAVHGWLDIDPGEKMAEKIGAELEF
ncbi:macro domain-containing protein [Desulfobacterota bacterium AH_259_B03_O07]|nr:macro domain-containing protein [Desulfobacterota bacterium AH_259_B03_O07]